jgi:hypothetical protein
LKHVLLFISRKARRGARAQRFLFYFLFHARLEEEQGRKGFIFLLVGSSTLIELQWRRSVENLFFNLVFIMHYISIAELAENRNARRENFAPSAIPFNLLYISIAELEENRNARRENFAPSAIPFNLLYISIAE